MKRVAAYCRVSTKAQMQKSSLELQMGAYHRVIAENPDWQIAGIYSDRGVTGTIASIRPGFQQMIQDAEDGKIDIIMVKSISRFARNTVDLLTYVRRLRERGVGIYFEKERIDTMKMDSEILLTIRASFAQEESHSISENSKRGLRNRMKLGIYGAKAPYGYRKSDGNTFVIEESEAAVVRRIYRRAADGASLRS